MIRVDKLNVEAGDFRLRDISFAQANGEFLVLLGPSGSGKSVLLESIAGFRPPESGDIHVGDTHVNALPTHRRGVPLVPQSGALFPHMTVAQNIAFPLRAQGGRDATRVAATAERLGVHPLLDRRPGSLSGGEAQRVALARALIAEPRVVMLDEPMSAVDAEARAGLRSTLQHLHSDGVSFLYVTHDFEEAVQLGDRIAIMEHGAILQIGTPEEIASQPSTKLAGLFAGYRNVIHGALDEDESGSGARGFKAGGHTVFVVDESPPGDAYLLLRPEDITLAAQPSDGSARNSLAGTVTSIVRARAGLEVALDVGFPLVAAVTESARDQLGLRPGASIHAIFKASAGKVLSRT